jgi:hypothetical protein
MLNPISPKEIYDIQRTVEDAIKAATQVLTRVRTGEARDALKQVRTNLRQQSFILADLQSDLRDGTIIS